MPSHQAYCHTTEITVFVHPDNLTRGVGSSLMDALMSKLNDTSASPQLSTAPASISEVLCIMALDANGRDGGYGLRDWYMRWGFEEVGRLRRVGFKFGIWVDTLILQLSLRADAS
jgi:L-amino acid N-acyltransferase YncA